MDTSKYYIKMCKKADEAQAFWKPKTGDCFYGVPQDLADNDPRRGVYQYIECDDEYYSVIPTGYDVELKEFTDDTDAVFLPSQADLQKMLDFESPFDLLKKFSKWAKSLTISEQELHLTMEQLWLGFVMEQNYHKKWDGQDWQIFNA
jgi:hypothetical protein